MATTTVSTVTPAALVTVASSVLAEVPITTSFAMTTANRINFSIKTIQDLLLQIVHEDTQIKTKMQALCNEIDELKRLHQKQ